MSTFRWNPEYATGFDRIDDQHRRLLDILSALGSQFEQGSDPALETIGSTCAELTRYAKDHFRTEEELMLEVGVDARHVLDHQREHHYFEAQVEQMLTAPGGSGVAAARQLLDFLVHWLIHHILGWDRSMARQARAIRAGSDPADAFARAQRTMDTATETLLHSVEALLEILSHRNRELIELTASLERRVAERTEALSAANRELEQAVEEVERMAMTDVLTGLPNRRHGMDRLAQLWALSVRHGHPLSCLIIDADGFGEVNDTHGHHVGDDVLKALAVALRDAVRSGDELCRLGGDEFLVIAPETPAAGALSLGERIRASIARLRIPTGAGAWHGSVSVGVAARHPGLDDFEALLRAADRGLYAAKGAGRNAVRADDAAGCGSGEPTDEPLATGT